MCTGMTSYHQPDGWISVKDRFPKTMERVLVYETNAGIAVGFYVHHSAGWYVYGFFEENEEPEVTHWRELPKPPRMENTE